MRRLRGLLLAVLLAAAQGSAWLHASVVSHVTCLEHGESIHAADSGDAEAGPGVTPSAHRLRADLVATGGHDHCDSDALIRWRDVALSAPSASSALPLLSPSAVVPAAPEIVSSAAAYFVAPKNSPPRSDV